MGLIEHLEKFDEEPKTLADFFRLIRKILANWIDFNEKEYYDIVALWILGTWLHDKFISYPYLFINAMKQSGKSRLLKVIKELARRGYITTNLTESVLFRLPQIEKPTTLCIDEFENISTKEKTNLRELLNSGYKKGLFVFRSRKIPTSEKYVVDSFEVYTPVAIANISGIDDVLEDRCIVIPLERSENNEIINKPEYFEFDPDIFLLKSFINNLVTLCTVIMPKVVYATGIITSLTSLMSLTTLTSQTALTTKSEEIEQKITNLEVKPIDIEYLIKQGIVGRYLELWYPILWLAFNIDKEIFENLLPFITKTIQEKKEIDMVENRDTIFLAFLFNNFEETDDFIQIREIVRRYLETEPEDKWFNSYWVGRALKRHRITVEKRKLLKGREIRINFQKLADLCKKLGIVKQEKDKIVEEIQADLKERPDWYDFQEEKEKSES